MSSIGTKRLTFDEWQALPETNQIREVVDGEVLSPSNTRREIEERLSDFRSIGVPEGWLVDFGRRAVDVHRLDAESATSTTFGMGDTLVSEVLPGFALPITDIFGPLMR